MMLTFFTDSIFVSRLRGARSCEACGGYGNSTSFFFFHQHRQLVFWQPDNLDGLGNAFVIYVSSINLFGMGENITCVGKINL